MSTPSKPAAARPRLGRGLSSLIASSSDLSQEDMTYQPVSGLAPTGSLTRPAGAAEPAAATCEIPLEHIAPNPFQPRREFNPQELDDLAQSIRQQGILQPLVVAPAANGDGRPYVLIAGERRLRAARQAGLPSVPCVVRPASRQQMLEWALVENIQRADLNPVERAHAYRDYVDRFGLTQQQAAERLGEPRATVANYLRLLDLCDHVQRMLLESRLSFGHAKVLAGLAGEPERQAQLAERAGVEGLSVRQLEQLLAAGGNLPGTSAQPVGNLPPAAPRRGKAAYILDLEERLSRAVGTRVTILPGRAKHTGRVVVEYYSLDDFDRIAAALGLVAES